MKYSKLIKGITAEKKQVVSYVQLIKRATLAGEKKKVGEYQIQDHGVESSDYFQGHGVSHTDFDDCATGFGISLKEALDDAAEQLASNGWELSPELEKEIADSSDEDEVNKSIEDQLDPKPDTTYTVTHHSRSMGDKLNEKELDSLADAQKYVQEYLKKLDKDDYDVEELETGLKWEITDSDEAAMVSDENGIIEIIDDEYDINDKYDEYLDNANSDHDLHYYASIDVKAAGTEED